MEQLHDWVMNHHEFEAVLQALNSPPYWEPEAVLRAYQTFGFDDASTPANDKAFVHLNTGVILRHDGEYVAIEFGDADLRTALEDLVHVLYQLGWRRAQAFHPVETIHAFMNDLGHGIPANMDFDIKAAESIREISRFAEGADLMGRSRELLGAPPADEDFENIVLGELASMGPEQQSDLQGHSSIERLERDQVPVNRSTFGGDQEALTIPEFLSATQPWSDADSEEQSRVETYQQAEPLESPALASSSQDPVESLPTSIAESVESGTFQVAHEAGQSKPLITASKSAQATQGKSDFRAGCVRFKLVRHGESFDHATKKSIHCWPGQANQPLRWDVFGEFDPSAPWFASALADALEFEQPIHAVCFAHGFAEMARTASNPTLRSLVDSLLDSTKRSQWFGPLLKLCDEDEFVREVISRLAGLMLFQEGSSFVEPTSKSNYFSVRSALEMAEDVTYAIHLDETDGPFAEALVLLLFEVASKWAMSSSAREQAEVARKEAASLLESEQKKKEVLGETQQMVMKLQKNMADLQRYGIDLSGLTSTEDK